MDGVDVYQEHTQFDVKWLEYYGVGKEKNFVSVIKIEIAATSSFP